MSWQCACGIVNKDSDGKCNGCGWTKERLRQYQGGLENKEQDSLIMDGTDKLAAWKNGSSNGSRIFFVLGGIMIASGFFVPASIGSSEFGGFGREVVNMHQLHIKETLYTMGGISVLCGVITKGVDNLLIAISDLYVVMNK